MTTAQDFSYSTVLEATYEEALARVKDALQEEGFGILTEIDVKATLKKKLDQNFRKYAILGACNPPYAYKALSADLNIGLLLPCNVIVYETDDKKTYVETINPDAILGVKPNDALRDVAAEISGRLKRVVQKLAAERRG